MDGVLLLSSGVLLTLSLLLSWLWHVLDKRADALWSERRRLVELNAKRLHPSEVAEHEEEVMELTQSIARRERLWNYAHRVRQIGVALLYASIATAVLGLLLGGIHVLQ